MGAEAVFIVSELCVHAHGADKRDEKTGAPQTLVFRGIGKARRQAWGRVIPITFAFFPWSEINVIERMAPMKGI